MKGSDSESELLYWAWMSAEIRKIGGNCAREKAYGREHERREKRSPCGAWRGARHAESRQRQMAGRTRSVAGKGDHVN